MTSLWSWDRNSARLHDNIDITIGKKWTPPPFYSKCSAITLEIKTPFLVSPTPKSSIYCLINSSSSFYHYEMLPESCKKSFIWISIFTRMRIGSLFKVRVPSGCNKPISKRKNSSKSNYCWISKAKRDISWQVSI